MRKVWPDSVPDEAVNRTASCASSFPAPRSALNVAVDSAPLVTAVFIAAIVPEAPGTSRTSWLKLSPAIVSYPAPVDSLAAV